MDTDIKSMTLEELKTEMERQGEKSFRAGQLYDWMHNKLAASYEEMTNIPLSLRKKLEDQYPYVSLKPVEIQESRLDGTRKFLFALSDGNMVESVWMKYKHGNSVCISSQVGCKMVLCLNPGRLGEEPSAVGDAGSDLCDYPADRRTGFSCGGDGNRGTYG